MVGDWREWLGSLFEGVVSVTARAGARYAVILMTKCDGDDVR